MACTDKSPCLQPTFRWAHSYRCRHFTAMSEFETYSKQAMRTATEKSLLQSTQLIHEIAYLSKDFSQTGHYKKLKEAAAQDERMVAMMYDALGLAGEAGEIADYIKKVVGHGKKFDPVVARSEAGDLLWYINRFASRIGSSLAQVAQENIQKLLRRYPDGFSHQASENRREEKQEEKD